MSTDTGTFHRDDVTDMVRVWARRRSSQVWTVVGLFKRDEGDGYTREAGKQDRTREFRAFERADNPNEMQLAPKYIL